MPWNRNTLVPNINFIDGYGKWNMLGNTKTTYASRNCKIFDQFSNEFQFLNVVFLVRRRGAQHLNNSARTAPFDLFRL